MSSKKRSIEEAYDGEEREDRRGSTAAAARAVRSRIDNGSRNLRPKDLLKQILIKQHFRFQFGDKRGVNEIIYGKTPLMEASSAGDLASVWMLLQGTRLGVLDVNIEAAGHIRWSALWWAAYQGHSGIFKLLLEHGANVSNAADTFEANLLHRASQGGSTEIVTLLLDSNYGFTVHDVGVGQQTPLHYAAEYSKNASLVELLINRGADLEARDNDDETPLHKAAASGTLSIVEFIIERGANLAARDSDGWTPLHCAADEGHAKVVEALLKGGAEVEAATDNNGRTPLHFAAFSRDVAVVQLLMESGADANAKDEDGCTPLMCAVGAVLPTDTTHLLLECGADVDATNNDGNTALHIATGGGTFSSVELLLEPRFGVNIDKKNNDGNTALHLAVRKLEKTRILLDRGASIMEKNNDGDAPLLLAMKHGQTDVAKLMFEKWQELQA